MTYLSIGPESPRESGLIPLRKTLVHSTTDALLPMGSEGRHPSVKPPGVGEESAEPAVAGLFLCLCCVDLSI